MGRHSATQNSPRKGSRRMNSRISGSEHPARDRRRRTAGDRRARAARRERSHLRAGRCAALHAPCTWTSWIRTCPALGASGASAESPAAADELACGRRLDLHRRDRGLRGSDRQAGPSLAEWAEGIRRGTDRGAHRRHRAPRRDRGAAGHRTSPAAVCRRSTSNGSSGRCSPHCRRPSPSRSTAPPRPRCRGSRPRHPGLESSSSRTAHRWPPICCCWPPGTPIPGPRRPATSWPPSPAATAAPIFRPRRPVMPHWTCWPPTRTSIVRGMGLAFIDLMALVTEGRGGRFSVRSAAGGARIGVGVPPLRCSEPRLWVGSRRGVPYHSKVRDEGDPTGIGDLEHVTAANLAAREDAEGLLDFRADVVPLIAAEMPPMGAGCPLRGPRGRSRWPGSMIRCPGCTGTRIRR